MKHFTLFFAAFIACCSTGYSQSNIVVTNPVVEQIMLGNFTPGTYTPTTVLNRPDTIANGVMNRISRDSLQWFLEELSTFHTRNTGSDTVSTTTGIGAARRWVHSEFERISASNENRLQVGYLQFDEPICSMNQHRNVLAVLPGVGPYYDEVVLVEAHLDSRCQDACDVLCQAHGMEDNGSGSALVLELARVMSKYTYSRTVVFMLTIGEEQGLWGAEAFAQYADAAGMNLKAVFNNDIVGGVICGNTASPPGCPGLNDVDSLNLRIYSSGNYNSLHKGLARFTKLEYMENIYPIAPVKNIINLMTGEDRAGRGGDHIPFRANGFTALRFTSANEHGHGDPTDVPYVDRQHTDDDILGIDTDADLIIDSFYVDMGYLSRNAVINANAIGMAAIGPQPVQDFTLAEVPGGIVIQLVDPNQYGVYRVGVRTAQHDFDSLYTLYNTTDTLWGLAPGLNYRISACTVDSNGVESLFGGEKIEGVTVNIGEHMQDPAQQVELLQNKPNPFDEATTISVLVHQPLQYTRAEIRIFDLSGKEVNRLPIRLDHQMNEVTFLHGFHATGVYSYSLVVDGKVLDTRRMVFAN